VIIGKFPGYICCKCPGETRWEGKPRSHFTSLLLQSATWHRAVNTHLSPSSLLTGLSPLWFCFVSHVENETDGSTFPKSVWHPKWIASGTRQHKENEFHDAFEKRKERWDHCVCSQGDYFEDGSQNLFHIHELLYVI
jgi:hypothetical protein